MIPNKNTHTKVSKKFDARLNFFKVYFRFLSLFCKNVEFYGESFLHYVFWNNGYHGGASFCFNWFCIRNCKVGNWNCKHECNEASLGHEIAYSWYVFKFVCLLVLVIMAGILSIYGLVIAIILTNRVKYSYENYPLKKCFSHLAAGLTCGLCSLGAGYAIGIVGDNGVRAFSQQPRLFVGMVLILIFAEVCFYF